MLNHRESWNVRGAIAILAAGLIGLCLIWFRKRRGDGRAEGRKSKGLGLMIMFGLFTLAGAVTLRRLV